MEAVAFDFFNSPIVHLIRHSLEFVSWKDRNAVVPALRAIYRANDTTAGEAALSDFETGPWGQKYLAIIQISRRARQRVIPFLCLSGGRAPDHLYDERDRRLELEAAPGRPHTRALPE